MASEVGGGPSRDAEGKQQRARQHRDWSSLPDTALLCISQRLVDFVDYFAFSRVCRAWRSVSEPATREFIQAQPPLLCSTEGPHFCSFRRGRFYRNSAGGLGRKDASLLGASHGYLITGDDGLRPAISVVNPFTGHEVGPIPPVPSGFSPCWAVLTSPPASRFVLLLMCRDQAAIVYWRRGRHSWSRHQHREMQHCYAFPAVLDGEVYAVSDRGRLLRFEFTPRPRVTILEAEGLPRGNIARVALVASHGEVLAVEFSEEGDDPIVPWSFTVYRLDLSQGKWTKLQHLGNRALFYNPCVRAVLSGDRPARWGDEANCIYYPWFGIEKLRVFHMEDGHTETLPLTVDPPSPYSEIGCPCSPCFWFLPSLCY